MEVLTPGPITERLLLLVVIAFFIIWNLHYGALIDTYYPIPVVKLYEFPLWRLLLVALVIGAISWCPSVGLLVALALFFYLMDMEHFTKPWNSR